MGTARSGEGRGAPATEPLQCARGLSSTTAFGETQGAERAKPAPPGSGASSVAAVTMPDFKGPR